MILEPASMAVKAASPVIWGEIGSGAVRCDDASEPHAVHRTAAASRRTAPFGKRAVGIAQLCQMRIRMAAAVNATNRLADQ